MQNNSGFFDISREQIELNDSVKLTLFGRVSCQPGWRGDLHSHDSWELVYVFKPGPEPDAYFLEWEGGEHRCDESFIFLVPPNTKHICENIGKQMTQSVYACFSFNYQSGVQSGLEQVVILPTDSVTTMRVKAVLDELASPPDDIDLPRQLNAMRPKIMDCIMETSRWIVEFSGVSDQDAPDRNYILIERVKEFVMKNLDRYISVDEISKQLYLSPNYLGQVFRQNTGSTIKAYHNQMRMELALHLLVSGTYTISEVADKLGFESMGYFSRRFKMFYGISPSTLFENRQSLEIFDEIQ